MASTDTWVLTEVEKLEAERIIALRDRALKECSSAMRKRLEVERRVRKKYRDNSDYKKHLRSGRLDLLQEETRDALFTPMALLEKAYYDTYKPRAERDEVKKEKNITANMTPKDVNDGFYDEPSNDTTDEPVSQTEQLQQRSAGQYDQNHNDSYKDLHPQQNQRKKSKKDKSNQTQYHQSQDGHQISSAVSETSNLMEGPTIYDQTPDTAPAQNFNPGTPYQTVPQQYFGNYLPMWNGQTLQQFPNASVPLNQWPLNPWNTPLALGSYPPNMQAMFSQLFPQFQQQWNQQQDNSNPESKQ